MADRVSASITIGGIIAAADYAQLCAIIADEGLSIEWDGEAFEPEHRTPGKPLSLHAHEVAWGRFAILEPWCVANGLSFARWSGAYGGEWDAERVVFTGKGEPIAYIADENDHVVINRATVERLGSIEAILAWFDAADITVPPLVVEGDGPNIEGIFAADRELPPHERTLPWQETKDGVTVVVEPKPHWAADQRAFKLDSCDYCHYRSWTQDGPRARFYGHQNLSGSAVMANARAEIAREIAEGLWTDHARAGGGCDASDH
jgi:hypothetical protein